MRGLKGEVKRVERRWRNFEELVVRVEKIENDERYK
jgi:hypothetical protein